MVTAKGVPEKHRRPDKQLVRDFGAWLSETRARLNWSVEELNRQIESLDPSIRFSWTPGVDAIAALEQGVPRTIPAWARLARMAIERAGMSETEANERLNEQQWYLRDYAVGDPGDMARPWVLRDEFVMLERMSGLSDEDRAAAFRFVRELSDSYRRRVYPPRDAPASTAASDGAEETERL